MKICAVYALIHRIFVAFSLKHLRCKLWFISSELQETLELSPGGYPSSDGGSGFQLMKEKERPREGKKRARKYRGLVTEEALEGMFIESVEEKHTNTPTDLLTREQIFLCIYDYSRDKNKIALTVVQSLVIQWIF